MNIAGGLDEIVNIFVKPMIAKKEDDILYENGSEKQMLSFDEIKDLEIESRSNCNDDGVKEITYCKDGVEVVVIDRGNGDYHIPELFGD